MTKKRKNNGAGLMAALMVIGMGATAFWAAADGYLFSGERDWTFLARYLLIVVLLVANYILTIPLHEAGHLICGLRSGYRFSTFRVLSFLITREGAENRLTVKRSSLPGTAGQCLLAPPPWQEGNYPWLLYNLGGVLMDLLCALIGLGLWALCPRGTLISVFLIGWTGMHFTSALQNGIPLDNGLVVNDAGNIRVLRQSPEARRAFWCALNVSDALRTTRLRDMPEDWFPLPGDGEPLNVLSVQLFCNRLALAMDRQDFPAARALLERMEDPALPLPGVHRASAALERMYLDLLEQGPAADISLLREAAASRRPVKAASHDPEDLRQRKIVLNCLRALERTSLTLQRVRYAAALLKDRDPDWQDASLRAFEAIAADSPYAGDTAMERELLETARLRAEASAQAPDKAE